MKTNDAGIELIKSFEGLRLKSYQDIVGIWTIGFGTTGPEIVKGLEWTEQQCVDRLKKDLQKFEKAILAAVKVPMTSNEFAALVCWTYNVGSGAMSGSTLVKLLNKDTPKTEVADQFMRWNKAGGKEVAGLTRRRKAEQELFLKPEAESKPEPVLPEGPSEADMNDIFSKIEKDIFK